MTQSFSAAGIGRRSLILTTAALAASNLGMPFVSRGLAAGTIKIGVSAAKGGPLGASEGGIRRAATLAVAQAKGKVLDQPIELVPIEETSVADTESAMRKAIEDHKLVGLIGGSESSRALAMQKIAVEAKVPLIVHTSNHDDITGKGCNRWTYRVPAPYSVQYNALAHYLAGAKTKKWFILGVDGTSGPTLAAQARTSLKAIGGTEVGSAVVPQATSDFTDAIAKIAASGADAVVGALYGESIAIFLKAWNAAGMKDKIVFAQVGFNDSNGWEAGKDAITGIFVKSWHFNNSLNPDSEKTFVKDYVEQFKGRPPSGISWQAFFAMQSLIGAVARAESPDTAKIRSGLETIRWPAGKAEMRYRDFDHQLVRSMVLLETKNEIASDFDWWDAEVTLPEKLADLDGLFGKQDQIGCTFPTA